MKKPLQLVLPVISAALLVLAFPRFNLWFLAWFALIPLFFAIEGKKIRERFALGYLFGLVFFALTLYWFVNVTIPGILILIVLLSLAPAIFCVFFFISVSPNPKPYTLYYIISIPAAWVFTEYLRTHLLTGFPWALLGYSQSLNLPVIQISDITGAYGVSFLIVIVNLGIYLVLRRAKWKFYVSFFIMVLIALSLLYGQKRISKPYHSQSLKVAVIQGNIPQEKKWDPRYKELILNKYETLTRESLKDSPSLVVWPETSVPGDLEEPRLKSRITGLAASGNIYLLVGTFREGDVGFFNSATLISDKGEILESYNKIHLVPLGEFIPFKNAFAWVRSVIDKPIGDFEKGREYTVFKFRLVNKVKEPDRISKTTEFYKFSALICFEDMFPDLCRNFVKKGARFLVNITNDAWFGKTSAAYQHAEGSVFRAVENRVPVIRAANTGVSCIIDHTGRVTEIVKDRDRETFVDGYVTGTIMPIFSNSIYTRFGDVFSWVCTFLAFYGIGFR
ncbi:apolipoprotein N-acyltransferase [Candidatus Omnitrophota bacterium]